MTGVEGWMWKHYARENPDSVKCDHCGEVFPNRDQTQNLTFHLCDEHNIIELDEHPERDNIQQNYKISRWQLMAMCNHCKKRINLATHGVHILTVHLKILHSKKFNLKNTEKRRLCIWDKFNQTGNNASYKGRESTKKINNENSSIKIKQTHFRFKNAHSSKYKLKKIRRIRVRDIYDRVDDNHMRCKRCKKTIKLDKETPITALNKHLHQCRHLKIKDAIKHKLKTSRIWDKYDKINDAYARCKICKKLIKTANGGSASNLYIHLRYCRNVHSEYKHKTLDRIRKISRVWEMFDKVDNNHVMCKRCEMPVKLCNGTTATLHQHLHYCSYFEINDPIKCKLKGARIWDKYDKIDDTYMKCKGCKKSIKVSKDGSTSNLNQHLRYCRHFKNDHPRKYELKAKKRKTHILDLYDELNDNHMMCKGCKTIIKIDKETPISNLRGHLLYCSFIDNSVKCKMKGSRIWDKYDKLDDGYAKCKGCKKTLKTSKVGSTSNLYQHLRYCRSVQTSPKSIKDNDFHGNDPQVQSVVRIDTGTQPLKRKREDTGKNDKSCSSTETDEDLREALMKSKAKKVNLRKRRTDIFDESCSSSECDEDLREALMELKTETKVYNLRKRRPDVVDKIAPSTSRSSEDEDFHDTV